MKKLLLAVCFLSVFFFPKQTQALSCIEPPSANITFKQYDGVIIGEVQEIERKSNVLLLTVEVKKSYKGVEDKVIKLYEDVTWGTSIKGTEYLFYLNKENGKWIHPLCAPTTTKVNNEFFEGKEELLLKEKEVEEQLQKKPNYTTTLVLLVAGFAVLLVIFFKRKRR
ncbi:hypothetical protein [Mangrovibacillus cuniculi]|uniref:Gram-positive cocci surface proteins LPxTG domain-containing protein n=1 Tax=Mangrovibacillus cuniculi TaxID=2593652 RepID=A0A7S8HG81_9BACI|nr:hypothetical protein [Mangrovibacillus cuniculi]QPC47618.1 hypothetical protein G8O30_11975 [Mangrovibacillus cuniculi]